MLRAALDPLVEQSLTGELAAWHMEHLFLNHGASRVLHQGQGPEFESRVFQELLGAWRVQDEPVPKAQPFDKGHVESFHGSLREELLDAELFHSLKKARPRWRADWIGSTVTGPIRVWDIALRRRCGKGPPLQWAPDSIGPPPLRGGWGCQTMQDNPDPSLKGSPFLGASQSPCHA
jgi:hypothetical protein